MIEKVTDRSLREIEVFAATQGTRVIFEEIDRSLQGIAPDDDPLGLKILVLRPMIVTGVGPSGGICDPRQCAIHTGVCSDRSRINPNEL